MSDDVLSEELRKRNEQLSELVRTATWLRKQLAAANEAMETNCEIRYMESDRANAAERELAAERERREHAEELLRDIPDGHLSYSQCITIACPICAHFAKYESEGSDD